MLIDGFGESGADSTDVCIIGAGPAGISMALRLARDPNVSIRVLESGGLTFEKESQELARAQMSGTPTTPVHESSIRALGGSTWSWGGACAPIEDNAYLARPWVEGSGWPIGPEAVRPYLEDALAMVGITPEARAATDAEASTAMAGSGLEPSPLVAVPVYFSRPVRFGMTYRQALDDARNIHVNLHAAITRLDVEDGRIVAATGWSRGKPIRVTAREFVLAGGGVANPRLLLVSGLGSPLVGRYFNDHPRLPDYFRVRPGNTPLWRVIAGSGRGVGRFTRLGLGDQIQRDEGLLNWHANIYIGYAGQLGGTWEAIRRIAITMRSPWNESPYFQDAGGGPMRIRSADVWQAMTRPHKTFVAGVSTVTRHPVLRHYIEAWSTLEQAPDPESRVELIDDVDPLGMPRVRVRWNVGEAEERTYRRAKQVMLEALERLEPGISGRQLTPDPWPGEITTNWHHMGTTRMSTTESSGVVDADCRVHGIANLHVAGSSIFPSAGSTAPTLPIVQFSLRLADHLATKVASVPVVTA